MTSNKIGLIGFLLALSLLGPGGCASPIIYTGNELGPGLPIELGDEITITEKYRNQPYTIRVTKLSETSVGGSLVDDPETIVSVEWSDLREIDAGLSPGITFKQYLIGVAASFVAICFADDDTFFGDAC